MDIETIQIIAGFTSSIMFASGQIPMLVKVFKTRNLQSYSLSYLVIGNLANLIHWFYIVTIPGPLWYLHAFFTITTAFMLLLYLCYEIRPEKFIVPTIHKSPPQSPHMMMTSHHLNLYPLVEEKIEGNDVEIHPYEENARGAA